MIVFLDFDGVMRRQSSPKYRFDEDCRERFEAVLRKAPGVRIVVTSSWRAGFSFDEIRGHFSDDIAKRVLGVTPASRLVADHNRYREIRAFLERMSLGDRPWVALDDDPLNFPEGEPNLLLVDPEKGFDDACALELSRRLASAGID